MIKRTSIEEVRQRADLYEVVSRYVNLKRVGSSYVGLSPFNDEKTPSFYVHPDRGFFKCFSSGVGGDVFRFVELKENVGFEEAVEMLADRFQVELEHEGRDRSAGPSRSETKALRDLHEEAAEFFHQYFLSDAAPARRARDYWCKDRGFSMEVAREWRIGLSPPERGHLVERLRKSGYESGLWAKSGLFFESRDRRSTPLERFRGRLMIPIHDVQARVCGFSARQMEGLTPDDDPTAKAKYVNSPDTPIFHKSRILFGFHRARTALGDDQPALLVEGQLDAIRCHSVGLGEAVAFQGSAATAEQLSMLRRLTPVVECLLDGDEAGQKAALRLFPLCLGASLELRLLPLPEGSDPDDLLREGGAEAVATLREKAVDPVTFFLRAELPQGRGESPGRKQRALDRLYEQMADCRSAVLVEEFLRRAAALTGLELTTLMTAFGRFQRGRSAYRRRGEPESPLGDQREGDQDKLTKASKLLLYLLFHHLETAHPISEVINCEWITSNSTEAGLLRRLVSELQHGLEESPSEVMLGLTEPDERMLVAELQSLALDLEDPLASANEALQSIYKAFLEQRRAEIIHRINELGSVKGLSDPDNLRRIKDLYREKRDLEVREDSLPFLS